MWRTNRKARSISCSLCDFSFNEIFSSQLNSILEEDDLLVEISCISNSTNILNAINYANVNNSATLAIVSYDGGKAKKNTQHCVWIPSFHMQLCVDFHLMFGQMVMKAMCNFEIID